ncbi:hypothetical protein SVTN_40440 (plasmid) [Streptomyces vietnamensis]|uniref:Uncharacterized protein n=1 Tax=Streptomyces vietnamensis TaxID=362257 RepID=A0A0B5I8T9_9ACTN|nr:hypothetical protein SVTN_40440 [Streptomyces vietnamensis]
MHVQAYGSGRVSSRVAVIVAVVPSWLPWKMPTQKSVSSSCGFIRFPSVLSGWYRTRWDACQRWSR